MTSIPFRPACGQTPTGPPGNGGAQAQHPALEFEKRDRERANVILRERADIVPFRPLRKRDEPPSRPLPPAQPARPQPLRPAASGERVELLERISRGRAQGARQFGELEGTVTA